MVMRRFFGRDPVVKVRGRILYTLLPEGMRQVEDFSQQGDNIRILCILAEKQGSMTFQEIQGRTGLNDTALDDILQEMIVKRYIQRIGGSAPAMPQGMPPGYPGGGPR
jgi:hypothetical protein